MLINVKWCRRWGARIDAFFENCHSHKMAAQLRVEYELAIYQRQPILPCGLRCVQAPRLLPQAGGGRQIHRPSSPDRRGYALPPSYPGYHPVGRDNSPQASVN